MTPTIKFLHVIALGLFVAMFAAAHPTKTENVGFAARPGRKRPINCPGGRGTTAAQCACFLIFTRGFKPSALSLTRRICLRTFVKKTIVNSKNSCNAYFSGRKLFIGKLLKDVGAFITLCRIKLPKRPRHWAPNGAVITNHARVQREMQPRKCCLLV